MTCALAHASPLTDEEQGLPAQIQAISNSIGLEKNLCTENVGCHALAQLPYPNLSDLPAFNIRSGNSFCEGRARMHSFDDSCRPLPTTVSVSTVTLNRFDNKYKAQSVSLKKNAGFTNVIEALSAQPSAKNSLQLDAPRKAVDRYMQEFAATKSRMVGSCCGSSVRCQKAYMAIPARFCQPTATNSCTTGASYRSALASPDYWKALRMRIAYHQAKRELDPATKAQLSNEANYTAPIDHVSTFFRDLVGSEYDTSKAPIEPGQVIVSPYMREGTFESNQKTLEHELSHGCSKIKKQINLISTENPDEFVATFDTLFPKTRVEGCDSSKQLKAYESLFTATLFPRFQMTSQQTKWTLDCFNRVAQSAQTGNSARAKCENACPAQYLEEAFAEFQRMNWQDSFTTVSNICGVLRDSLHGFDGDFAECIAQNSEKMRAFLRHGMMCEGSR
jgi:hypothetical protein